MNDLRIGVVLGSTREGRVSPQVGNWVLEQLQQENNVQFELVDIKDYNLPFLGTTSDMSNVAKWNQKLDELDGFVFVVAEYNHSLTGALKNAIDSAKDAWANKAAAIVSYGSIGGARAAEHLKAVLLELQVAPVRTQVLLSLFTDFEQGTIFKPQAVHQANLTMMKEQLINWATALKTVRAK